MNRHQRLELLREHFNDTKLLNEIVIGMSNDEFKESYEHINRMWDLHLPDNDDEIHRRLAKF